MHGSGSDRAPTQDIDGARVTIDERGVIRFEGHLTMTDAERDLEPCLLRWHESSVLLRRRTVTVDLSSLDWMSESAIRSFVRWAMWIEGEPRSKRYRLVFRVSSALAWQIAAFGALATMAPDTVRVAIANPA